MGGENWSTRRKPPTCNKLSHLLPFYWYVAVWEIWGSYITRSHVIYLMSWLAAGWWFSPGTPVFSAHKTDHQDITEIYKVNHMRPCNVASSDLPHSDISVEGKQVRKLILISGHKDICLNYCLFCLWLYNSRNNINQSVHVEMHQIWTFQQSYFFYQ
jgi:hypothetical protein